MTMSWSRPSRSRTWSRRSARRRRSPEPTQRTAHPPCRTASHWTIRRRGRSPIRRRPAQQVEPEDRPELLGDSRQALGWRFGVDRKHIADDGFLRRMRNWAQRIAGCHRNSSPPGFVFAGRQKPFARAVALSAFAGRGNSPAYPAWARLRASSWMRSFFAILPTGVRGKASRTSSSEIISCLPSRLLRNDFISSSVTAGESGFRAT
jgi:hypothetical protein